MVVLIAGLNFLGYVLVKVFGSEHGLIVSILAASVEHGRHQLFTAQREEPAMSSAFVLAIVSLDDHVPAVVVIVGMVNRSLAGDLALALGLMAAGPAHSWYLAAHSLSRERGGDRRSESLRARRGD